LASFWRMIVGLENKIRKGKMAKHRNTESEHQNTRSANPDN